MDFGMYPPEVNSGRMYTGPGSGPMLAAAAAWDGLAYELQAAANSYREVIAGLTTGSWGGASAVSMAAAAAPYAAWMSATAAQAEETAIQARAAAAAYEVAFASTVPPPVIATNRSQLMALVATNFFGQNTPAIAITEAQYAEMWAQDAAAMYGYASSSASATTLTPFTPPGPITNPAGLTGQAVAVGQAVGTPAGNAQSTVSTVPQAFSAVPNALQSLATVAPTSATDPSGSLTTLANLESIFLGAPGDLAAIGTAPPAVLSGPVDLPYGIVGALTGFHTDDVVSAKAGVEPWPGTGPMSPTELPATVGNSGSSVATVLPTSASVSLGQANMVGPLSVPPTWTVAEPDPRSIALTAASPGITRGVPLELDSKNAFSQMALASIAGGPPPGRALGTADTEAVAGKPAAARPRRAMTTGDSAPPSGSGKGSQNTPRIVVTGIAARIRELAELRDCGILTNEEFVEQKNRLLGH
ncbi:MAG: PPE domain-containing protein [Mycobacterium sp.]|uniref:PPE domain-containing protein n=1 Tax=Mycobacterium sp. TaxID=1785 RepID=UPI002614BBA8|nr:PPE domain-containing protein [Mycobacterium sp.]MDI3314971.1 PPE domain-containing protein [Mycobacterium sp.]